MDEFILVRGRWYVVEEVHGDSVFASDKDGEEYEFPIDCIEQREDMLYPDVQKQKGVGA